MGRSSKQLAQEAFVIRDASGRVAYAYAKRSLDLVLGAVLFVLTLPIVAALAMLIRLDSPGPIIFAQSRVAR
ncbi:MAG TPA: sugar transferase, partial [Gemmatimonadaceae bacterium]|nr:sugar transferase [Gemmatimonadaceae bacterium]